MNPRVRAPLWSLAPLFRPQLGLLAACSVGLFASTGLQLVGPWLVANAVDAVTLGDGAALRRYGWIYVAVVLAQLVISYASRIGIERVAQGAMQRLKEALFDHLLALDLSFHDKNPPGRLMTRVQGDTQALQVLFAEVILSFPADVLLTFGMIAMLYHQSPVLAAIVAGVLPLWGAAFTVYRRWSPPLFTAQREVTARLTGFLAEHLRAMPMLRSYERGAWVRARGSTLNGEFQQREIAEGMASVYLFNALFAVRSVGFAAVLWGGGLLVLRGDVTIGVLVMGLGYLRQLFNPLMRLSVHLSTAERARAAARRIAEIRDTRPTIADPPAPKPWPGLTGALRLEAVGFRYDPNLPDVLSDVSIEVPAGTRIGIVGATGSGKSTIVQLLLRFRDPTAGRVTVDGVDLRDLAVADVRARIGYVAQDVRLFAGTVLDNLGTDEASARRALAEVGLALSPDATIARDGANLSRGERQLLNVARALARDPELLLLDEATSAVDPATEGNVQAATRRVLAGRTAVIVAHRLATVQDCDRILVLDHGRVVESGSHAVLVARQGAYAQLYALQRGEAA